MGDEDIEYFKPTSGRLTGSIGVLTAVAVIGVVVIDGVQGPDAAVVLATAFLGVLMWTVMLRPRVGVSRDELVVRNLLSEARIPLAAIEQVVLRQVLVVRAGDRRYISPALGRSLRSMRSSAGSVHDPINNYCDFVEDRIRHRTEEARTRAGFSSMPEQQASTGVEVRRDWAWAEVAALLVTGVGFVIAILV